VNGEIVDKLGDFGNMLVAARINKIRQFSAALERRSHHKPHVEQTLQVRLL